MDSDRVSKLSAKTDLVLVNPREILKGNSISRCPTFPFINNLKVILLVLSNENNAEEGWLITIAIMSSS